MSKNRKRISEAFMERLDVGVPHVRHIGYGEKLTLLWKNKKNKRWYTHHFVLPKPNHHPSEYEIDSRCFVPDGYGRGGFQEGARGSLKVGDQGIHDNHHGKELINWNNWEKTFKGFLFDQNYILPKNAEELNVALWEVFVQTHDSFLVNFANSEVFFKTVDETVPIDERISAINQIKDHLSGSLAYENFRQTEKSIIENFPFWIQEFFPEKEPVKA